MGTFVQKDMTAALFPNDRKQKETHADWTGAATIVCKHCGEKAEVYLNAWAKNANGKDYFSISIKPKEAAANQNTQEANGVNPTKPKAKSPRLKTPIAQPK